MNWEIERSLRHLLDRTEWKVEGDTFQILDEETGTWVARVSTTHLAKEGMDERSFTVIGRGATHMVIYDSALTPLGQWITKQVSDQQSAQ